MIQIDKNFIRAFSPDEQLVMLRLLLNADENGRADFCERGLSKETGISYKTIRNIHKRLISDGILKGASKGAVEGADSGVVTICDYDSYTILTKIRAHLMGASKVAFKEQEGIKKTDKDFPHTHLQTEKINNQEQENNTPYNPPTGDESEILSKLAEMEKAFSELSEENKKLKEENELLQKKKRNAFVPPSVEEVDAYVKEQGFHFDASAFVNFYESKGWLVGKNKMKDWKAACRTWEGKRNSNVKNNGLPLGMILQGDREALISEAEEWG